MNYYNQSGRQSEPHWNNAISYAERMALGSQWKLFLPQLIIWTLDDLTLWENVEFEEIENNKLLSFSWINNLLKLSHNNKTIYITDNHNHALYFRYEALHDGLISKGAKLLHVDQHADMNEPASRLDQSQEADLEYIAEYVNTQTQIASFIQPALRSGLLSECIQIRSEAKLEEIVSQRSVHQPYILDIDIDFFAEETDVSAKIAHLQTLMQDAQHITIATSPYFIDQNTAISLIRQLLS